MDAKRLEFIDIAKAFAMLLVIIGHSIHEGLILNCIYSFHMPLFFFVSGYFFRKRSFVSLFQRNMSHLFLPYVITALIRLTANLMVGLLGHGWTEFFDCAFATLYCCGKRVEYGSFYIPSCGAIWFLPALSFATIVVNWALLTSYPTAVVLVVSFFSWLSAQYFILPFGVQAGGFASLFVYAGMQERTRLLFLKRMDESKGLSALLAAGWITCALRGGLFEMVSLQAPILPVNILGAFCGTYTVLNLCEHLSAMNFAICSWLGRFGQNTLIVLCTHLLEMKIFPWRHIPGLLGDHASSFPSFVAIVSIRILIACSAIVLCERSKVLR